MAIWGIIPRFLAFVEINANLTGFSVFGLA
jgi:hypothetical protein